MPAEVQGSTAGHPGGQAARAMTVPTFRTFAQRVSVNIARADISFRASGNPRNGSLGANFNILSGFRRIAPQGGTRERGLVGPLAAFEHQRVGRERSTTNSCLAFQAHRPRQCERFSKVVARLGMKEEQVGGLVGRPVDLMRDVGCPTFIDLNEIRSDPACLHLRTTLSPCSFSLAPPPGYLLTRDGLRCRPHNKKIGPMRNGGHNPGLRFQWNGAHFSVRDGR